MQNDRAKYQGFKITVLASALILAGCAGGNKEQLHSVNWLSKQPVNLSESSGFYEAGKKYFGEGRYGLALEQFNAELKKTRSSLRALNGIAACYDKLGRYHVAMRYYDKALRIDPDSSKTLNNLGYSLLLQGKSSLAEKMFSMAQKKDPSNTYARKNRERLVSMKQHGSKQETFEQPTLVETSVVNVIKNAGSEAVPSAESKIAKSAIKSVAAKSVPEVAVKMLELEKTTAHPIDQEKQPSKDVLASSSNLTLKLSNIESPANTEFESQNRSVVELETVVVEEIAIDNGIVWEEPIFKQNIAYAVENHAQQSDDATNEKQASIVTMALPDASFPEEERTNQINVDAISAEAIKLQGAEKIVHLEAQVSSVDFDKDISGSLLSKNIGTTEVNIDLPAERIENTELMFGPTKAGNTLWKIAADLSAERGVGINQMIKALAMSNPEAFINGEIDRLKIGFMLWVPSNEEVIAINMPEKSAPIEKNLFAFSLEVANGNGRRGMAKMISIYLEEKGAQIARVSDAKSFAVKDSTIYYMPGYHEEALRLAQSLPVEAKIEENAKQVGGASVRLVIGKDLLQQEAVIRRALISRSHV